MQQAKRQRELEHERKKKEAQELRKLEVRCNLHLPRENAALTSLKEEKRLKQLEREAREARELKERLEVCRVPHLVEQYFIPGTS